MGTPGGPWPLQPEVPPGVQLAGPGQRLAAFLLDAAVSSLVVVPGYVLLAIAAIREQVVLGVLAVLVILLGVVVGWLHLVLYLGRVGRTVGKHVVGIEVRHLPTGRLAIGAGPAFAREFLKGLGLQILGLGVLWILWDRRRQGLHDQVMDTVVVVRRGAKPPLRSFLREPFDR